MPGALGNLGAGRPPKADPLKPGRRVAKFDTLLPLAGYTGPVPPWPLDDCSAVERRRWEWLWRRPQATEWIRLGIEDLIARYVRNCITLELGANMTVAQAYLVSEVRQQEDRLGRTPLAMQRMRWDIAPDEVEEMRDEQARRGSRPRLRAIDPGLAADG